MLKNKKLPAMLAAFLLGAVLLTGCGGSDDTSDDAGAATEVVETDGTTEDTE